ncbi:MAG TPA: nitronate monooxygenase [Thermoanaerobaculia bacterium]|nr:nitronate monooxygenase [Thermoanaerobaculia bacterium]
MSVLPKIIQGGMGAGVSNWTLANAVSRLGQLGVVSGTALDVILARRLQDGDPGGHMRRAIAAFPFPEMAGRVLRKYFVDGGRPEGAPYRAIPMYARTGSARELVELCIVANFVEVWLAREGHDGPVGINYLEKIQLPVLPSIYGAMLAGVAAVLMGAGIPIRVPGILDHFVLHEAAEYPLAITGSIEGDDTAMRFSPADWIEGAAPALKRPLFLPIIASNTLALTLQRKANGRVDGFIIEGPTAGGHNAPPRGKPALSATGEPVYGERDVVDLAKMREMGLPFWLAGGRGTAEGLQDALVGGAAGIQVGTAFAYCDESGLDAATKARVLALAASGGAHVFTDPVASPTGFPFKVVQIEGTLSSEEEYLKRTRICDLGYLREPYRREDGSTGYRCASEPVAQYVAKGGGEEYAQGRKCLCNALMADIGIGQTRGGVVEKTLVTSGDDVADIARFLTSGSTSYSAADVVRRLLETAS